MDYPAHTIAAESGMNTPVNRSRMKTPVMPATERNKDGMLKAYTRINVTDIFGRQVSRRVSLGTEFCIELQAARDMVEVARRNNSVDIQAEYRINL